MIERLGPGHTQAVLGSHRQNDNDKDHDGDDQQVAEWLGLIDDDDTPNIEGTYYLHGGHSYALPTFPLSDEESFDTLEDAWAEWLDRRSNQRRFPCWGDGGPDEPAIILGDEAETYGAWTPREASAELPDYDDIDDIYNPDFWG